MGIQPADTSLGVPLSLAVQTAVATIIQTIVTEWNGHA
jgi:hypothetical protein